MSDAEMDMILLQQENKRLAERNRELVAELAPIKDKIERGELAEVVRGEWIYERFKGMWPCGADRPNYKCPVCGDWTMKHERAYCPNCGANMKGEQNARVD